MHRVACIGGACIDRTYRSIAAVRPGTSNPAHARRGFGGVARNVAENLARLGVEAALLSVVGEDENGTALIEHARAAGIDTRFVVRTRESLTAEYAAFVDAGGGLIAGMSDMGAMNVLTAEHLEGLREELALVKWVFVDCNVSPEVLQYCISHAHRLGVRLAVDAVSEPKVRKLPADLRGIDLLFLNESEAAAYGCETPQGLLQRGAASVILTRGARGLIAASAEGVHAVPAINASCLDVTGAGDALVAATLYRLLEGDDLVRAARIGTLCAGLTVESPASVRSDLSPDLLFAQEKRLESAWAPS